MAHLSFMNGIRVSIETAWEKVHGYTESYLPDFC